MKPVFDLLVVFKEFKPYGYSITVRAEGFCNSMYLKGEGVVTFYQVSRLISGRGISPDFGIGADSPISTWKNITIILKNILKAQ